MRRLPSTFGIWLLGVGILLLFFWKLAFTNLIFARGDTFLYFYPYWDYRAQGLLAGHLPLWNPYLFMGAPFLANSQAGVLYPLNWPLVFFPAPIAVKISILLHLLIAASGTYVFARRALGQSWPGALLATAFFTLGGYLTSQVEHVNQLQGLAWFPWLMLAAHPAQGPMHKAPFKYWAARIAICALILSLQLLAGHTQSAFISLTGVVLYVWVLTLLSPVHLFPRPLAAQLIFTVAFITLAFLLASAQLLPTLELSSQSLRGGGLPLREALSFSLDPRLLGRALLPGYSRGLFSEYVAYIGVVGLGLAALGINKSPQRLAMLILAAVGLGFALGAFNPLYALLAVLPPFNLFRVPARWLFLFAFGIAMLAGYGLDQLQQSRRLELWPLGLGILPIVLTPLASGLTPAGETGPMGLPAFRDWLGWLLPLAGLLLLARAPQRWRAPGAVVFAITELFFAAQVLPYNHLTTPEAYSSVRPAMTQLLSHSSPIQSEAGSPVDPAPRFLSMSALRFDPGDLAELRGELDPQLPPDAVYDAIVATKNKEVLSPNLSLKWGVPAVDGFDGGILPLRHYADFTALFTGAVSADGRLRENLTTAPDPRLLALVNVRYLITDKVNDAWVEDVFYDQQFTLTLGEGETATIAYVPKFRATALGLVLDTPSSASGSVSIAFTDQPLTHYAITTPRVHFDQPGTPVSITLTGPLTVRGLSLIDERSGAFHSLTLGPYRLAHSGDVKIYDLLTVLPRAFVVPEAVVISDNAAARAALADPTFDPASTVILASGVGGHVGGYMGRPVGRHVGRHVGLPLLPLPTVTDYEPEYVRLTAEGPGYLLLTDAYYPGWVATLDGMPTPLLRADIMFRAVELPEGTHTVEFRFEPRSVTIGLWVSGLAWVSVLIVLIALTLRNKKAGVPKASTGSASSSVESVQSID